MVTLCASEILDLPTTVITSLPQLAPDGTPLAAALEAQGQTLTALALAAEARISLNTACAWLCQRRTGALTPKALLSAMQSVSSSTADNTSISSLRTGARA